MKFFVLLCCVTFQSVTAQFGFGGFGGRLNNQQGGFIGQFPGLGGNLQIPGLGVGNGNAQVPGLEGRIGQDQGAGGITAQVPGFNVQLQGLNGLQNLANSAINAALNCEICED